MPPRRASVVLAAALVATAGFGTCDLLSTDDAGSLRSVAGAAIGFELLLGAVAVAAASFLRGGLSRSLGLGPSGLSRGDLLWLVVGTLGASHALDAVIDLTGLGDDGALARLEDLVAGLSGSQLASALVVFALAPGICEELLCRGLIQRAACRRLGVVPGVVLASVVFGALHVDPTHAVFATVLGVYLGVVSLWSGGVRASILCHVVNNAVALAVAARLPDLSGGGALSAAGGAGLAAAALWRVWGRRPGAANAPADGPYS